MRGVGAHQGLSVLISDPSVNRRRALVPYEEAGPHDGLPR
jgi:hypothetical protein